MLVLLMCLISGLLSQQTGTGTSDGGIDMFCQMDPAEAPGMYKPVIDCFAPLCEQMKECPTVMEDLNGFGEQAMTQEKLQDICGKGCLHGMFDAFTDLVPCIEKATGEKMEGIPTSDEFGPQLDAMCSQNPVNGEYCLVSATQMSETFPELENTSPSDYTTAQNQTVCGFAGSKLGCCVGSMLALSSTDDSSDNEFTEASVLAMCGWKSIPKPCGKFGETKKSTELSLTSDILWSDWSSMNENEKLAAQYAATQDLKSTLGLDLLASTFTESADGKVVLNFNIDSTDDSSLGNQIQQALASQAPDWTNLANAIPKVTAVTTSNANVKEEDVTHVFPDSSSRKMPGFFVLSSVLFLWALF